MRVSILSVCLKRRDVFSADYFEILLKYKIKPADLARDATGNIGLRKQEIEEMLFYRMGYSNMIVFFQLNVAGNAYLSILKFFPINLVLSPFATSRFHVNNDSH